ncbi:MAG TPA: penicillin acylase family protein [Thermoanaerobaculia bacterium]|jgi:penicillin amidase|nr:penicillin acylase family protein [Thermoanaerobaculia bacterium]
MATPSSSTPPRRSLGRRIARWLLLLVGVLLLVLLVAGLWLHHRVKASLPELRGEMAIPGLSAPVTVERDALGTPAIKAATRLDAARALGFVHAQDRFFQMDLLRREASGEFAEMFGPFMLLHDQNRRRHGCRALAGRVLAAMSPPERALMEAYAEGVNAGLKALGDKPFEYIAMRAEPRPWRPEDSILAIYAMYFDLEDWRTRVETDLGQVHDNVPQQIFDFVEPAGTEWDAPLVGSAFPTPPVPGPGVLDLRKPHAAPAAKPANVAMASPEETLPGWEGWTGGGDLFGKTGSNSWAVSGAHTADGHALLANDMHLGITIPNIWYRASWSWREPDGTERRVTGTTLPGMPVLATGSTGSVAWGFTNSFADVIDLIDLEVDPRDPEVYRTPAGPRRFEHSVERIKVKGKPDEMFDVAKTIWGPVVERDEKGHARRALAWTADFPEATNIGLFGLEAAKNIDEAIEVAHASGIPPQNFVVADSSGRVGWTIVGKLPRRVGWYGQVPSSWADGTHRWDGWLRSDEVPKVVDPPSGRIWSANNRAVDGEMLARLGDGCYDLGPRAMQIRDRLLGLEKATPKDMLALQLDDRALFLAHWHDLLLKTLTPEAVKANPQRGELRRLLETTWTGRASVDSVAYRVVREFRDALEKQVFASLTGLKEGPSLPFFRARRRFEGPLWRLVTERPAHLLDPRYASWDAQLLAVADEELRQLKAIGPNLADRTWGERNTLKIHHPLSLAVPPLARWLDVPAVPIPGDLDMPRVIGEDFAASERMVVSPGHEESGIFHMPVGESGHPLSPHYRDGHTAWREGLPTPLLPGPAVDVLKLVPKG